MSLEDLTPDQLVAYARQLEPHAGSTELLRQLGANPKTREKLQRLIKEVAPGTPIPELDAVDRANETIIKPLADRIDELQRQVLERNVLDRLERERGRIKSHYHLSDEDVQGVEALMVKSDTNPDPIPSYDAAARVFVATRMSAAPTPAAFSPPTYQMPEKEVWARGIGNPQELNRIAMNEAINIWNDLAAGKVPGLGANRGAPMFAR